MFTQYYRVTTPAHVLATGKGKDRKAINVPETRNLETVYLGEAESRAQEIFRRTDVIPEILAFPTKEKGR